MSRVVLVLHLTISCFGLGARETDYLASEEVPEVSIVTVDESEQAETAEEKEAPKPSIRFVSCATGSETPGPPEEFVPPKTPETENDDGKFSLSLVRELHRCGRNSLMFSRYLSAKW